MSKIYDCFPLFNELDLLTVRLDLLYDHVDYFVISECDSTFSGLDKPFYFEENRHLYKKYEDKIIYVKNHNTKNIDNIVNTYSDRKKDIFDNILSHYNSVKNTPLTDYGKAHWCRDFIHKEYILLGLDICEDDDNVIFSDLDEIPNPDKILLDGETHVLNMRNMCYYLNRENISQKWYGSIITKYSNIKNGSLQKLRLNRTTYDIVNEAGWHLSNMGGTDRIIQKIKSWGHQEYNNQSIIDRVEQNVKTNGDIFNRNIQICDVDIHMLYPPRLIDLVQNSFKYLIHD